MSAAARADYLDLLPPMDAAGRARIDTLLSPIPKFRPAFARCLAALSPRCPAAI